MFNILLVPLDGSPQTVHVVELAGRVAAPGTATVHLLCVVDPSYALPPGCEDGVAPDGVDAWPAPDPGALTVMRRVKARFDPAGVFRPGTFVGGI